MSEAFKLARNKSGKWEIRWSEYDEAAGRSRSRSQSCGTSNKRDAGTFKAHWLIMREQLDAANTGWSVGAILDAYIERHVEKKNASLTNKWSLVHVRKWFADYGVGGLTEDALEAFKTHRLQTVVQASVRKELSALKAALNWAASPKCKPRILRPDDVPFIDLPPKGAARMDFLCAEDAQRLFDLAKVRATGSLHFRERRIGLFICVALETAARKGAVTGLTWDRVSLDRGQIDFRDPGMEVTNKRRVPVPISRDLLPVLQDAYERRDRNSPYVLGHSGGVANAFTRFREQVGFPKLKIHDMRRTWATLRVMWGANMGEVAAILGDTVEITEKHYAHFQPGYGRGAMDIKPQIAAE